MQPEETETSSSSESSPCDRRGGARFSRLSVIALAGSNLLPLFGVLFAGWRVFPILLLFSLENIVIGFYNVLRMRRAACDPAEPKRGLIGFFCVHYGGFVFGHMFLLAVFFGPRISLNENSGAGGRPPLVPEGVYRFYELLEEDWRAIGIALVALWVSHGISYLGNFIQAGEYKRVTADSLVARPYGRVMAMHGAIVLGAAVISTGTHVAPLALLVVLKIVMDLIAHLWERKKFQKAQTPRQAPAR